MTLTKLPLGKWWVETDKAGEITATYNKAQIEANIKAITETLKLKPDLDKEDLAVSNLLTVADKDTELINKMYQSYKENPEVTETIQLKNKLDSLNQLLERLK